MAKQTQLQARKNKQGEVGLSVSEHTTDSPIIPIDCIERLHAIKPDKVDWLFEQTEKESEFRRKRDTRVNSFIFIERILGQIFALLMGLAGISASVYLGVNNHDILAGTIATATIATLAVSFIKAKSAKK